MFIFVFESVLISPHPNFLSSLVKLIALFITIDKPDAPGKPLVSDITENTMTLTWTAPQTDGGSPITSYVIEKKERFSVRWSPVEETGTPELSYTVTGLTEGSEYDFRVVAKNKAGAGTPSDATGFNLAKPPYGKIGLFDTTETHKNV